MWQTLLSDLEAAQGCYCSRAAGRVLERGGLGFSGLLKVMQTLIVLS
jgi:hypothetical protein